MSILLMCLGLLFTLILYKVKKIKFKKVRKVIILILIVIIMFLLFKYFSIDSSVEEHGETIYWNNSKYIETSGAYTKIGKVIAKSSNGNVIIKEIKYELSQTTNEIDTYICKVIPDEYISIIEKYYKNCF